MILATTLAVACRNSNGPDAHSLTHPAGLVAVKRVVGSRPYAAAITPSGRALVALLDNQRLISDILPAADFSQAIAVGNVPTDVSLNAAGDRAFIANQFDDNIQVVVPNTGQTITTIPVRGTRFRWSPMRRGRRSM